MFNIKEFYRQKDWIHSIQEDLSSSLYIDVFQYQYKHNEIYRKYVDAIKVNPKEVKETTDIPFLPIIFFKTHQVTTGQFKPELIFGSSGTTGMERSLHHVKSAQRYRDSFHYHFERAYGPAEDFIFLCLLPSYLERKDASLAYMAEDFIQESGDPSSFYLHDWASLIETIEHHKHGNKQIILLGVTFALLDFAEAHALDLSNVWIMETGGMKGRREHWNRTQVHTYLKERWNNPKVLSEYGMTELLGQAYTRGGETFYGNAAFKPMVRDLGDPLRTTYTGQGALNIIDLANIDSCCFIATEDLVRVEEGDAFEILGRLDHAALRGCSLMTA